MCLNINLVNYIAFPVIQIYITSCKPNKATYYTFYKPTAKCSCRSIVHLFVNSCQRGITVDNDNAFTKRT